MVRIPEFTKIEKFDLSRKRLLTTPQDYDIESQVDKKVLERIKLYHPHKKVPKEEIGLRFLMSNQCVQKVIHFDPKRLAEMKKMVISKTRFSSNDCVGAHMWKLYAATTKEFGDLSIFPFQLVINMRERMTGLKNNFIGNSVYLPNEDISKKDILSLEFTDLVMRIRGLINLMSEHHVQVILDCVKKYTALASTLWRKTSLTLDDWRLVDKVRPSNFGIEGVKECSRVALNPPAAGFFTPQMMFVNLHKDGGILITCTLENSVYEKIKHLDLSDPKSIEKVVEIMKD